MIALWLGHESVETTQIYLDANLAIKEQALARTTPPSAEGRACRRSCSSVVMCAAPENYMAHV